MIYYLLGVASGVAASRILLFSHVYEACVHAGQWIKERKLPF